MVLLGDDLDPEPDQRVLQPVDRLFVPGNDARRKDHDIAGLEHDVAGGRRARSGQAPRAARLGFRCRSARSGRAGCSPPHPRSESAADRPDSRSRGRPCRSATASARPAPLPGHGRPPPGQSFRAAPHSRRSRRPPPAHHSGRSGRSSERRKSASDPEVPGRSAFVESPTSARTPSSPSLRSAGLVRGRADQRVRIELPVAGMQHGPDRRAQRDGIRFGDRMGQGDQFEVERADREAARQRHHIDPDLIGEPGLGQLGAQQRGGKRGRPNRAAQLVPQIGNGADVILMRVRRDDPEQAVAAFDDESRDRA